LCVVLISTVDKKPLDEFNSELMTRLHEPVSEKSPSRRLGIRDLPMPPMPSDADDDAEEDENDGLGEQVVLKNEDDLDSIVKSYVKNLRGLTSPTEMSQQSQEEYVLMYWIKLSCVLVSIKH